MAIENLPSDAKDGRPTKIIYETQCGVILHITPLSPITQKAIQQKSEVVYPDPDPSPFVQPVDNAAPDADVQQQLQLDIARRSDEYLMLRQEVEEQRNIWRQMAVLDYALEYPGFRSHDEIIEKFRHELARLRQIAVLPDDDWETVLNHFILAGVHVVGYRNDGTALVESDREWVLRCIYQNAPLDEGDVIEGIRFFRVDVSRSAARKLVRGA